MRFASILIYLVATSAINAASIPNNGLALLEEHAASIPRDTIFSPDNALEKRKGGGGKGGGGSSSSGGKSGGSSSSSSSSSSSGSSRSSSAGGQTKSGSGVRPTYGGSYYGGGATIPYSAGSKSTKGLLAGGLLGAGLAVALMPGLWLYSVYPYHFTHPYNFVNQTVQNATQGVNQTLPVTCLCQQYSPCGCDDNDDQKYYNDLVGNGSYAALNKTLVTVSDVNGTRTLVINGTLANGTTAAGGTDSAAPTLSTPHSGYWIMGLLAVYAAFFL